MSKWIENKLELKVLTEGDLQIMGEILELLEEGTEEAKKSINKRTVIQLKEKISDELKK